MGEMVVLTDVTQGGASLAPGELELMVHRRIQADDSRGVQEPLNETMCGCNDINADPGKMGEHGHEGDGGCQCVGLTIRGSHFLILDTVEGANEARRAVQERVNFPPELAFLPGETDRARQLRSKDKDNRLTIEDGPTYTNSFLPKALPANVKLQTLTSNYADINDGALLVRLTHLFAVGEHSTLSQPVDVCLDDVTSALGLGDVTNVFETILTGT